MKIDKILELLPLAAFSLLFAACQNGETEQEAEQRDPVFWNWSDLQKAGTRGPVRTLYIPEYDVTYAYDRQGYLTSHIVNYLDDSYRAEYYTYDDQHRVVQYQQKDVSAEHQQTGILTVSSEYGNGDRMVSEDLYPATTTGIVRGLSRRCTVEIPDGANYKRHEDVDYEFNADGNLTIVWHTYYETDGQELLDTSLVETYDTVQVIYRDGYPYSNGYIVSIDYFPSKMIKSYRTWSADIGGDDVSFLENDLFWRQWQCVGYGLYASTSEYRYNEQFDELEFVNCDETDTIIHVTYYDYEYDEYDNWTYRGSRWEYSFLPDEVDTMTEHREITYYH